MMQFREQEAKIHQNEKKVSLTLAITEILEIPMVTCEKFVAVVNFCANGMRENVFVNLKVDGVINFFRQFLKSPFRIVDEILEVEDENWWQFFQQSKFPRFHLSLMVEKKMVEISVLL